MVLRPSVPPDAVPEGRDYRIRPLKRGDREIVFRLLAADGWPVPAQEQETALSWVVQHPELESFVAHEASSFSRVIAVLTLSHRPQLKLGGRVACIDLFAVAEEHRHRGVGADLLAQAVRRAEALGCKRMEIHLTPGSEERRAFFEQRGFSASGEGLFVRRISSPLK